VVIHAATGVRSNERDYAPESRIPWRAERWMVVVWLCGTDRGMFGYAGSVEIQQSVLLALAHAASCWSAAHMPFLW
jgi:hypothetical protein